MEQEIFMLFSFVVKNKYFEVKNKYFDFVSIKSKIFKRHKCGCANVWLSMELALLLLFMKETRTLTFFSVRGVSDFGE